MVAVSLYNLVNTFWVARLGYQAVAALTVIMPFYVFCIAIGVGTGIGINALSSRRFGERNVEAANQVAGQSFFLSLGMGAIFLLATSLFPRQIMVLCGATPDIIDLGEQYLTMLGRGMPLFFFSLISRNVFHASGDTLRPMMFTIIAQVCNAVLDPFLIFGFWIFPEMGVAGAALGTVISSNLGALLALGFILGRKTAYRIRLRHCRPNLKALKAIYQVGLPSMVIEITESIVISLFNHIAAGFGSMVLAALGIAMRIFDLAFMPVIGTSHGLLPIVGFSFGAQLWDRLWKAVRLTSLWLAAFMALLTVLVEIFTRQIIGLFNPDPALIEIAVPGMRIAYSTFVVVGPAVVFITTFQGLSKGKVAMLLSFARQLIFFVPGLFILTRLLGLTGLWISLPVSDVLGALTAGFWIYREYRQQKKRGRHQKGPPTSSTAPVE
jgi:putative MATE family efflux protein